MYRLAKTIESVRRGNVGLVAFVRRNNNNDGGEVKNGNRKGRRRNVRQQAVIAARQENEKEKEASSRKTRQQQQQRKQHVTVIVKDEESSRWTTCAQRKTTTKPGFGTGGNGQHQVIKVIPRTTNFAGQIEDVESPIADEEDDEDKSFTTKSISILDGVPSNIHGAFAVQGPMAATSSIDGSTLTADVVMAAASQFQEAKEEEDGGGGDGGGCGDSHVSSKEEAKEEEDIVVIDDEENVMAKVVSKEQQMKEAFEIVEKSVPHAEEVDVVVVEDENNQRRIVVAVIIAMIVALLATGISIGVVRSRTGSLDGTRDDNEIDFTNALPAPNGIWDLRTSNITSTCGDEAGWFSTVTMTVANDGVTVHTKGIKSDNLEINGTLSMSTVRRNEKDGGGNYEIVPMLTIGPTTFFEAGGNTSFTFYWNVLSNTHIHGYEVWTWTDSVEWDCFNGTAIHDLIRIG